MPKLPSKKIDDLKRKASQVLNTRRKITCIEMGKELLVGKNLANKIIRSVRADRVKQILAEDSIEKERELLYSLTVPRGVLIERYVPKRLRKYLGKVDKDG